MYAQIEHRNASKNSKLVSKFMGWGYYEDFNHLLTYLINKPAGIR